MDSTLGWNHEETCQAGRHRQSTSIIMVFATLHLGNKNAKPSTRTWSIMISYHPQSTSIACAGCRQRISEQHAFVRSQEPVVLGSKQVSQQSA